MALESIYIPDTTFPSRFPSTPTRHPPNQFQTKHRLKELERAIRQQRHQSTSRSYEGWLGNTWHCLARLCVKCWSSTQNTLASAMVRTSRWTLLEHTMPLTLWLTAVISWWPLRVHWRLGVHRRTWLSMVKNNLAPLNIDLFTAVNQISSAR